MVCWAPKLSFRDASCCNVEVVKGAGGLRLTRLRSTEVTENVVASTAARARCAFS